MKRILFLSVLLPALFVGCEHLDMVRSNPVVIEIDGTSYRTDPDQAPVFGENLPDAAVRQYEDLFIFSINDMLYSKKREECAVDVDFVGSGVPEPGVRYPLVEKDSEVYGPYSPTVALEGSTYDVEDGWVEFSEFGVNEEGTRAYASGTFRISVKGLDIAGGRFGRMLECTYSKYMEQ